MDLTWRQLLRRLTRTLIPQTIRHKCSRRLHRSLKLEELESRLAPATTAAPVVSSILRSLPAGPATNATSVAYQVTFSETVTGVDAADFQLIKTGTVGATIAQITPVSGSVYTVDIGGISGNGTLGLNLVVNNTIHDLAGDPLNTAPTYQNAVNYSTGTAPFFVTAADLNGDGRTDLIVANFQSNTVSVLLGNGNGTFQPAVNYAVGSEPISVTVADLNGDGHPDLIVANAGSSYVSVLLGNGNGTFQSAVDYGTGSRPESVAVADVNGDGIPDLIVANVNTSYVSVLLGNGDGTFQPAANYTADSHPRSVAVADLNGDGHPDIIVANQSGNDVSVLLNNGNGTFQSPVNYNVGSEPQSVALADVNGDGHLDIVAANYGSNNVSVLLGNGNGTFQPAVNYAAGSEPRAVAVADLTGDGHPDIIVANQNSNNVSMLLGNGNGTFQPAANFPTGSEPTSVAVANLNGDGQPDLVVANYGSSSVSVLLGNGTGNLTGQVYTIDQTPPTVILTTPANGSSLHNNEPTFSGTADTAAGDSATITVNLYSGSSATATPVQTLTATVTGGTYSVTPTTPLTGVTYTAQASQTDDAGNTGLSNTTTFSVSVAPAISSAAATTFVVGTSSTFIVTAAGTPVPTLTESGALPTGITFNAATGVLGGIPAPGTVGSYPLTFTAANGVGANATQNFTLTIAGTPAAPTITSAASANFLVGAAGTFTMTVTGIPTPVLTESGALPSGVTFNASTGILSGTPAPGTNGSYSLIFTAANGTGANATQSFTLTVASPIEELGAYRPSNGSWSLDSDGTPGFNPATDQVFYDFSPPGVTPVAGDWTGNGVTEIGYFDNGVWGLDLQDNGVLTPSDTFTFGQAGDIPVVGDWTGNGVTDIGVFRAAPDGITGEFILDTNGDHKMDAGDETFTFGLATDHVIVGDWNGQGKDEVGVYRNAATYIAADAGDMVFSLDAGNAHTFNSSSEVFVFGLITDGVVIGDWNGAGKSEVGVYRPATAYGAPDTAVFSLDTNGDLKFDAGDQVFEYGYVSDDFVSGNWAKTPPLQPEGTPQQAQFAANGQGPGGAAPLTEAQLEPVLQQAIAAWVADGASATLLNSVQVRIGTLNDNLVGWTNGNQITLDATADGWGWNTNTSTADFTTTGANGLQATPGSAAAGKMDLLTVVEHELGHELGLSDVDPATHPSDLMAATLPVGTRRTIDP
jgi:FG-GAP-like repeat/Putative Ig domain/Bacterial Ig-like domain/FG-GAP repeat